MYENCFHRHYQLSHCISGFNCDPHPAPRGELRPKQCRGMPSNTEWDAIPEEKSHSLPSCVSSLFTAPDGAAVLWGPSRWLSYLASETQFTHV